MLQLPRARATSVVGDAAVGAWRVAFEVAVDDDAGSCRVKANGAARRVEVVLLRPDSPSFNEMLL